MKTDIFERNIGFVIQTRIWIR